MKESDKTGSEGESFYNEALTGSGTITPDGTYAEPQPDPTLARGGVTDGRTTPGGRRLPDLPDTNPPAQRADSDSAEAEVKPSTTTSKTRNQRS